MIKKRWREALDDSPLTIQEVADRAGYSRRTVSDIVHCKTKNPRVQTIARIARALGIRNPGWLVWRSQER